MKIVEVVQCGEYSPSQWDCKLEDGRDFYARYRSGRFYCEIVTKNLIAENDRIIDLLWDPPDDSDKMTTEQMFAMLMLYTEIEIDYRVKLRVVQEPTRV